MGSKVIFCALVLLLVLFLERSFSTLGLNSLIVATAPKRISVATTAAATTSPGVPSLIIILVPGWLLMFVLVFLLLI